MYFYTYLNIRVENWKEEFQNFRLSNRLLREYTLTSAYKAPINQKQKVERIDRCNDSNFHKTTNQNFISFVCRLLIWN